MEEIDSRLEVLNISKVTYSQIFNARNPNFKERPKYKNNNLIISQDFEFFPTSLYEINYFKNYTGNYANSCATSQNGKYQAVGHFNSSVSFSNDRGLSWKPLVLENVKNSSLCMSADGRYILATCYISNVYLSSDYGENFSRVNGIETENLLWLASSMSSDGKYMAVCGDYSGLYISNNFGATFTLVPESMETYFLDISISESGKTICAAISSNNYIISRDYGKPWIQGNTVLTTVAVTDDIILGAEDAGSLKVNKNQTWTTVIPGSKPWNDVDLSYDGKYMIAVCSETYVSTNYGETWSLFPNSSEGSRTCCCISGNGQFQLTGTAAGKIYQGVSSLVFV